MPLNKETKPNLTDANFICLCINVTFLLNLNTIEAKEDAIFPPHREHGYQFYLSGRIKDSWSNLSPNFPNVPASSPVLRKHSFIKIVSSAEESIANIQSTKRIIYSKILCSLLSQKICFIKYDLFKIQNNVTNFNKSSEFKVTFCLQFQSELKEAVNGTGFRKIGGIFFTSQKSSRQAATSKSSISPLFSGPASLI